MTARDSQVVLSVAALRKEFPLRGGGTLVALDDLTLGVQLREFVCVVGPSGCGKTTLLRILAGLESPTAGNFDMEPAVLRGDGRVAMVFQDYSRSLFPWYSVRRQLALACRGRHFSPERADALIDDALRLTGLREYAGLLPQQLSGGMQQRVALARALVMDTGILLMDEPFGSVDAHTRYQLEDEVLEVWRARSLTVLFVTHDIDEALYLADRVIVLSPRPAKTVSAIDVDLPRPRSHSATRADPAFGMLRRRIWDDLHEGSSR